MLNNYRNWTKVVDFSVLLFTNPLKLCLFFWDQCKQLLLQKANTVRFETQWINTIIFKVLWLWYIDKSISSLLYLRLRPHWKWVFYIKGWSTIRLEAVTNGWALRTVLRRQLYLYFFQISTPGSIRDQVTHFYWVYRPLYKGVKSSVFSF